MEDSKEMAGNEGREEVDMAWKHTLEEDTGKMK